jgi:hypothetical protein
LSNFYSVTAGVYRVDKISLCDFTDFTFAATRGQKKPECQQQRRHREKPAAFRQGVCFADSIKKFVFPHKNSFTVLAAVYFFYI